MIAHSSKLKGKSSFTSLSSRDVVNCHVFGGNLRWISIYIILLRAHFIGEGVWFKFFKIVICQIVHQATTASLSASEIVCLKNNILIFRYEVTCYSIFSQPGLPICLHKRLFPVQCHPLCLICKSRPHEAHRRSTHHVTF